jgi:hypothetical protein
MCAWPARLPFTFLAILSTAASAQVPTRIYREPIATQPGTTAILREPIAAGAPPAGLVVTGTPYTGKVSWQPATGATSYVVTRWFQSNPSWYRATSPTLTTPAWTDNGLEVNGAYVYQVVVNYGDGKQGSANVTYQRPEPKDPTGFTATQTGEGEVKLTWQAVPGVSTYLVGGPGALGPPGAENQGLKTNATTVILKGVPAGEQQWTVASWYDPGGLLTNGQTWPKASTTVASHSGRYRITVIGFSVGEQTVDDQWNWDGKGDEVYLAAYAGFKDRRNGTLGPRGYVRSVVYGDVNNLPDRISAGSLSDAGGLKTGDSYPLGGGYGIPAAGPEPDRIPLKVWEGPLTDGAEELLIVPTIWESDRKDTYFARWWQALDGVFPSMFDDKPVTDEVPSTSFHPVVARELDLGIPTPAQGNDRPLNMRPAGWSIWLRQPAVVLTREKIESALSSPYSLGGNIPVGVIPVAMIDYPDDHLGTRGSYTMYLRVQRVP